jgi:hypothetical protein
VSHVETVNVTINNLAALRAACERLGVEFVEGKKTYKWYGRSVGDYPLPKGFTATDLGKCDHVIKVPGVDYEVGLVAAKDGGKGFNLIYDFYGPGAGLQRKFCAQQKNGTYSTGMEHLVKAYSVEVIKQKARQQGYTLTERINAAGKTQLFATVR